MSKHYNTISHSAAFKATSLAAEFSRAPLGFVDVGARGGVHDLVAPIADITTVLAFEPDEEACKGLLANQALVTPWADFRLEPLGLGEFAGPARLHLTAAPTNHSLLPGNGPFIERYRMEKFAPVGTTDLQITTLDQVIFGAKQSQTPHGEIIKLDTQGTELAILRGAEKTLREHTIAVVSEVEFCQIYQDQPLFSEMELYLRALGFSFYGFQSIHLRSGKRIDKARARGRERALWAEAVFFKDPLQGSAVPVALPERSRKALVLAAMALGYFDFALELALASWATGDEAEQINSLIKTLAAVDSNDAVAAVEALTAAVTASPEHAHLLLGRFIDRRRWSWDYDDVPPQSGEPQLLP
ncbi:hypothetical protein GCM10011611_32570 [Aliidongia dinghuensis]|uniref:Methyltransferase FkbM domain-containing protein n=1 Tax=Aliidongia dinghuensis TaxID=1867774 RepID=A0A8J3E438_9PROT|nr:FkbM family methyltransferase [Aliidongia dinghuensis]GGF23960.1 hypothetical protein GCM10011611_32570 [Aliidongia dinghuensis]